MHTLQTLDSLVPQNKLSSAEARSLSVEGFMHIVGAMEEVYPSSTKDCRKMMLLCNRAECAINTATECAIIDGYIRREVDLVALHYRVRMVYLRIADHIPDLAPDTIS